MNKYLTIGVVVILLLLMFGSSMMLFLYNSTSLPTDVCSDCYPLSEQEIKNYKVCKNVLVFSALGLLGFWIKEEINN